MVWWREHLAFSSDRGAVTAEFMLITPALILAVVTLLGLFPLALSAIRLESVAMNLARSHSYGHEVVAPEGFDYELIERGRMDCLVVVTEGFRMESEYCVIAVG